MLMSTKAGPSLKLGLKSRSLGQILVKKCVHSTGHSLDPVFVRNFCTEYRAGLKLDSVNSTSRSLGQILEKTL